MGQQRDRDGDIRHDDRAQPGRRGLEQRINDALALPPELLRVVQDQDRVVHDDAHQHDDGHHAEDVDRRPSQEQRERYADGAERHGDHDGHRVYVRLQQHGQQHVGQDDSEEERLEHFGHGFLIGFELPGDLVRVPGRQTHAVDHRLRARRGLGEAPSGEVRVHTYGPLLVIALDGRLTTALLHAAQRAQRNHAGRRAHLQRRELVGGRPCRLDQAHPDVPLVSRLPVDARQHALDGGTHGSGHLSNGEPIFTQHLARGQEAEFGPRLLDGVAHLDQSGNGGDQLGHQQAQRIQPSLVRAFHEHLERCLATAHRLRQRDRDVGVRQGSHLLAQQWDDALGGSIRLDGDLDLGDVHPRPNETEPAAAAAHLRQQVRHLGHLS